MDTKIINAENAPAAVGPYCHAVEAGDFVFTSGQIGLDPQTQELPCQKKNKNFTEVILRK